MSLRRQNSDGRVDRAHEDGFYASDRLWAGATDRTLFLRAFGLLLLPIAGWGLGGLTGALLGAIAAAIGLRFRPVVTVAVVHVLLLAPFVTAPAATPIDVLADLLVLEIGVIAIVASDRPFDGEWLALTAAVAIGLTAMLLVVTIRWGLLAGSLSLVSAAAFAGYGIHRYEVVSLGLIEDEAIPAAANARSIEDSPPDNDADDDRTQ